MRTIETIQADMRAILDAAEGRALTDEEVTRYETLEGELQQVQADQQVRQRQRAYDTPNSSQQRSNGNMRSIEAIQSDMRTILRSAGDRALTNDQANQYERLEVELQETRDAQIRQRQAGYDSPRNDLPVQHATQDHDDGYERAFEHFLRTGERNSDLVQARAQSVGTDSEGGFLAPDRFRSVLIERMLAFGGIAGIAQEITTEDGNPLRWPTVDDTGNTGEIVAEAAAPAAGADVVFGEKELLAFRYTTAGSENAGMRVSRELLQDSAFDIQGFLTRAMATRIARAQAAHWATGTRPGAPQGITAGTTGVTLAGQTVTYGELLDMIHSVDPEYRDGANWVMNDDSLREVRSLTDTNNRPLWLPSAESGMTNIPGGMLLGYPVTIAQGMPSFGSLSVKPIAFGDFFRGYVIRRVQDLALLVDPYTRANNGQVVFHAWLRADGVIQDDFAFRLAETPAA